MQLNCCVKYTLLYFKLLEEWREHLDNNKTAGGILKDLSKSLGCFPYDLFLAKLAAYGTDDNLIL